MKADRQKTMLIVGGAVVLAAAIFLWVVEPLIKEQRDIARDMRQAEQRYVRMLQLEHSYKQAKNESMGIATALTTRPKNFTLFAFVEQLANSVQVRGNIEYMRPSRKDVDDDLVEEIVEMRLNNISLSKLVDYLHRIESASEGVRISRFIMRTHQKDQFLDVDLMLSTYSQKA